MNNRNNTHPYFNTRVTLSDGWENKVKQSEISLFGISLKVSKYTKEDSAHIRFS